MTYSNVKKLEWFVQFQWADLDKVWSEAKLRCGEKLGQGGVGTHSYYRGEVRVTDQIKQFKLSGGLAGRGFLGKWCWPSGE